MDNIKDSPRYNHVFSSLMFCSQALQELRTMSIKYELEPVNELIKQAPFNFYRGSLSSMITLEYCKIFNPHEKGEALSNISKLWEEACLKYECLKMDQANEDVQKLKNVKSWNPLKAIKRIRNKKVAHSDDDDLNKPFNIRVFSLEEIDIIVGDLDTAINVLNIISKQEDDTVLGFPHQSTGSSQTRNFIHYTAIARAFHDKNMMLAYQQGFQAIQQKIVPKGDDSAAM